jgi:hypothetical protein
VNVAGPELRAHTPDSGETPSVEALVAILSPVLLATVLLLGFIVSEAAGLRLGTFQEPATVSEALALGDAATAVALIRAGQDPNERAVVSKGLIDSHQPVRVTSLQAAVLARRPEFIALMLRHGARLDESPRLACLISAVGIGKDVPPAIIGVDALHDDDVRTGGIEALEHCGLPSD